ncbi:hypothetical protein AVEN_73165-1 [Araneus ventricosus]|uniref:Tc1-like transposase DDE domain-containing protein n=1 Tax=Araneus ventricosus TaxID=182803 RepID=A0A4Y2VX92_ARAVE|nr:hypothetical protein AVEN_73165-1 [Araneus ventricosus]
MSLTITSTTANTSCQFELSCQHVNIAGRIHAPTKCKLCSVICFLQAEGWFAAVSCQTLQQLGRAILTSGIVLIHDNTHSRSAVVTQQFLEQFKCCVSDLPTYSPNLTTIDFHLFFELKNWLGGQTFQKNEEIQSNVKTHYWQQHSSKRGLKT